MDILARANKLQDVRSAIQTADGSFVIAVNSGAVMRVVRALKLSDVDGSMPGVREYQMNDEEVGRVLVRELW